MSRPPASTYQRPYDLRHSFASLLLHEGRSVIYVARQLGHGAQLTMRTYGHVVEDLEDQPRMPAEDAILAAAAWPAMCGNCADRAAECEAQAPHQGPGSGLP